MPPHTEKLNGSSTAAGSDQQAVSGSAEGPENPPFNAARIKTGPSNGRCYVH